MTTSERRLHEGMVALAATALDFGLDRDEAAALDGHLGACPACARAAAALRADAAILRHPAALAPSRRVDAAVLGAIAGRPARPEPARLLVLVAATLLLLVALLGVAAAGAFLLRTRPPEVLVPSPTVPAIDVVPGPTAAPALDQSFEADAIRTDYAWTPYAYRRSDAVGGVALAQTVTAGMSGTLQRVAIRATGRDLVGDLPLEIHAGTPDGALLATGTLPRAALEAGGWIEVPISPGVAVADGTVVAIVLPALAGTRDADTATSQPRVTWVTSPGDGYPAGAAFMGERRGQQATVSTWSEQAFDRHFRTYVRPSPTAPSTPTPAVLPVASGVVRTATGAPGGGLYAIVNDAPGGTVIALLDARGEPNAGWPVRLPGWNCDAPGAPLEPVVAADGGVRLVCVRNDAGGGPQAVRAFAFDRSGRLLPGWPVDLPSNAWEQPRLVDGRLVVAAHESSDQEPYAGAWWLVTIAADGSVTSGARVAFASDAGSWPVTVGPAGVAYRVAGREVTAFDANGLRPGWPVVLAGDPSAPAFDAEGRVVFAVASGSGGARIVTLGPDGAIVRTSDPLPVTGASAWSGAGPAGGPMAPLVAADGTTFVTDEVDGRAVVHAVGPSGAPVAGWPYHGATGLQWQGACDAGMTGCGVWRARPVLGADGVVRVPLAAPDAQIGGSLAAVSPAGTDVQGWPMHLARRGAEFWSVVVGSDGTAFGLAVEPESEGRTSATIVAFAADGTVRFRTTVVDPAAAP